MRPIKNILLIEDNRSLSRGITLALRNDDTNLTPCLDLATARAEISRGSFELLILDINLPDGSLLDFLRE